MVMENLALIAEMLVGKQPIRYNRHMNKLYVDMDWNTLTDGEFLLVEAYQIVDPTDYVDVWKDQWLMRYATALIKRQWGANLSKFTGMTLPGGVQFNGQTLYNEAIQEIDTLEHEMIHSFSLPVLDMVG
jgi:hypothetical protein